MSTWTLVRHHPWKFIISILVSLVFIYFAFRGLDWNAFWTALTNVRITWILLAALLLLFSNVFRAIRWAILLDAQKTISRSELFQATLIGYLGNNVLPLKMGEALRAFVVARRHGIPLSGVGGSIVVERGLDVFSFFLVVGLYAVLAPEFIVARWIPAVGLAGLVGLVIFAGWMNRYHDFFFEKVESWSARQEAAGHAGMARQVRALFKSLESVWRMPQPVKVLVNTLVLWGVYYSVTLCGMLAFQFEMTPLEYLNATMVFMAFTTFSMAVPAAPGYVGTYHGAAIAALLLFAVQEDTARAFAVVMHLLNYLVYTPTGAIALTRMGIKLGVVEELDETPLT